MNRQANRNKAHSEMPPQRRITVREFFFENRQGLHLTCFAEHGGMDRPISELTVNRPGLLLSGFAEYFGHDRIQVIGNAEVFFLETLATKIRRQRCQLLCSRSIPCIVFCREYTPGPELLEAAQHKGVPVFTSSLVTMDFINRATIALEKMLAPRDELHGTMVDIQGMGVIILGEAGIGKSECALALIERGYSLVADDVIRLVVNEGKELIGSAKPLGTGLMEVRGIGVINVLTMFGVRSLRTRKRVDLVVTLRQFEDAKDVERVGMEVPKISFLGIEEDHFIVPVGRGRDTSRLVELAALHGKARLHGFNPAKELEQRILREMGLLEDTSP